MTHLGYDAELIRYRPKASCASKFRMPKIAKIGVIVHKLAQGRIREKVLARRNMELDKKRDFNKFVQEHIKCSKEYEGIESLRADPPRATVYLCGSDQIWGKNLLDKESAAWFLDFGDEEVSRIAYAPSIGRDYDEDEIPVFKRYLSRFQSISTREESAAQLCRQLGFKAEVVIDPTLLLDCNDYLDLIGSVEKSEGNYLFAYILNVKNKNDISWREVSKYISDTKLDVRAVYSSGYYQARRLLPGIDPEYLTVQEWIAAIRDANCVITTSFHGAVFCILLNKPFIAFPLLGRKRANDRLLTLLSNLDLTDRLYSPIASFKDQMEKPIAWEKVNRHLDSLRARSRGYLEQALMAKDNESGYRG